MVIDTSALAAVLLREPEASTSVKAMEEPPLRLLPAV